MVELLGEKHARRLQDLVAPAQVTVLAAQRREFFSLGCGEPIFAGAVVGLVLADPDAQRLGVHPEIPGYGTDRSFGLSGDTYRPLTELRRVLRGSGHEADSFLWDQVIPETEPPSNPGRFNLARVWETERAFELHLETAIIAGRADVILDREDGVPGAMAIVDYKTGVDGDEPAAVHEHQLRIYTSAGRKEGIDVRAAYLMDLKAGATHPVEVTASDTSAAEQWAATTVARLQSSDYPATPDGKKCIHCDVAPICRHGHSTKGSARWPETRSPRSR